MRSEGKASSSGSEDAGSERIPLPNVRAGNVEVVGLMIADVHLCERAPIARAEKKSWLESHGPQARTLDQVHKLQVQYNCPVFIVGDLFDRWDSSAYLINFALVHLPENCIAIAGNHDLPNHLYSESFRSAYWTLVEAKKITNLTPGPVQYNIDHLLVSSFPCGFEVSKPQERHGLALNVALIHDYIWTEKTGYQGAPDAKRYGKYMSKLRDFDVAVFGDNHKGFLIQKDDKCSVLNCGSLMRRKSDEINYQPSVGLLHSSGKITRHFLDVSGDEFTDMGKEIASIEEGLNVNLSGFIEEMMKTKEQIGDWKRTVYEWIKEQKLSKDVREIIIRAIEGGDNDS